MEMPNTAMVSSSTPKLIFGFPSKKSSSGRNIGISSVTSRRTSFSLLPRGYKISISALAHFHQGSAAPRRRTSEDDVLRELGAEGFASISSSSSQKTSSIGFNPQTVPPPTSNIGSPLFWIGVGVGLSALFSWVATNIKKYAMQQAMKSVMGQMNTQNSPFSNAGFQMNTQNNPFGNAGFPPGSPFPFPVPPGPLPTSSSSSPPISQSTAATDISATKVEAVPTPEVKDEKKIYDMEEKKENRNYAFVDVSPEETLRSDAFEITEDVNEKNVSKDVQPAYETTSHNGAASKQSGGAYESSQSTWKQGSGLSFEALEKMMEDPTVQKMVYPYLPEEMRNPTTFKWMLQQPEYRQQLEDMLNNMGGSSEWDNRVMDTLKNFDLNSPEVKQQFDQIGVTPEEVISKILANPDVAMAFQNPRVQQAIMECSQNPLSIAKYQNDKEVMDVFNKISTLFPGMSGPPPF